MSIADKLTSIENHLTEDYNALTRLGADLSDVDKNIENIADVCDAIYEATPKVTDTGSNLTLTPTRKGGLTIVPKGACEQFTTTGKNLFNCNAVTTISTTNWTISYANNILTIVHNNTYSTGTPTLQFGKLPSGTYILSGTFDRLGLYLDSTYTKILTPNNTFTCDGTQEIELRFPNAEATTLTYTNMQLEKNSTATSYEPYTNGASPNPNYPQDIKVVTGENSVVISNKNFFDGELELGTYSSSTGVKVPNDNYVRSKNYILVEELSNYKFSKNGENIGMIVYEYKSDYSYNLSSAKQIRSSNYLTTNSGTKYITFRITEQSTDTTAKIQLEKGTTATTYVAHAEQNITVDLGTEYLAGIGDYDDGIEGKPGEWKIVRKIGKVVYTGANTESWSDGDANTNRKPYYISIEDKKDYLVGTELPNLKSNYFREATNSVTWYSGMISGYPIIPKRIVFCMNPNTFTTLQDWKTWLNTHNTEVYYQLATPTEETITNQTLITDLNNIYYAMGYDGTTNISITSSNAQMIAQVSALKGE